MSTWTAAPAQFGGVKTEKQARKPAEASIFPLVLTYALLPVLVFLAARGTFSFEYVQQVGATANESGGTLQKVTFVLAFAIMAAVTIPLIKPLSRLVLQQPLLFMLPLWGMLSTMWSLYPIRTFPTGVMILLLTLFAYYIAVRFTPQQQMQLFIFGGVVATVLSYVTIAVLPRAGIDHKNSTIGLEGIYPQKNICAVITIELLMAGFCYTFRGKNAPIKRIAFVSLLTLLILGTMARTGWILMVLMIGFVALLKGLHRLRALERFVITWFLPAVAIVLMWLVYENSGALLALIGKGATLSGRTGVWQVVFLAIAKRPWLGFGYGGFWVPGNPEVLRLAQTIHDPTLSNAENGVLELWLDLGLIGVLMLFFLLIRSCKNAITCFRSNTPNYAIWCMAIIFFNLLSLVDGNKFMLWTSIEWVLYVVADIGLANEARRVRALRAA